MAINNNDLKQEGGFTYIEVGEGKPLLLLHGLFGALSNWNDVTDNFRNNYKVIIPMMPIYTLPLKETGLDGLVDFVKKFIEFKGLSEITILGNSLGGHVGLILAIEQPLLFKRLILTGSSGLFENTMGGSYPKRGNYDYIKERVGYTFYDPKHATKELVDEVFEIIGSLAKCQKIIIIARSAQRHNMAKDLPQINMPTLLVWGLNDTITPPRVGHEFNELIPNSTLKFIDKCGHAPMMEHPKVFNSQVESFLQANPL